MPVSDALSLNPPIEEDILDLLPPKKGDAEPSMEFQIPTKTHHGKYQQVLFTLHFKVRAKTKGIKFPQITEMPSVFEYKWDPNCGQISEILEECPQKWTPLCPYMHSMMETWFGWTNNCRKECVSPEVQHTDPARIS